MLGGWKEPPKETEHSSEYRKGRWADLEKGNHRNLNLKDCIISVKQEMTTITRGIKKGNQLPKRWMTGV